MEFEHVVDTLITEIENNLRFIVANPSLKETYEKENRDKIDKFMDSQFIDDNTRTYAESYGIRIRPITEVLAFLRYIKRNRIEPVELIKRGISVETNRVAGLDAYESKILGYIQQSRSLINSLPPKTRAIVEDMKSKQSQEYVKLKEIASTGKLQVSDLLTNQTVGATSLSLWGASNPLKDRTGNSIPANEITEFVVSGHMRAFFIKIPSMLSGMTYDVVFGHREASADSTQGGYFKKLLHIRNIQNRQYNFKFKAWWGPMSNIFDTMADYNIGTLVVVLRVANVSDDLKRAIVSRGFCTAYCFATKEKLVEYCNQLLVVRKLNFKVKSTVQRLVRGNMAKFLNTDKKIVNEISNYTYNGK